MIVAVAATITVLVAARAIVLPLLFAALIAFALSPLVRKLQRRGVPSAVTAAVLLAAIVATGVFGLSAMSSPMSRFLARTPAAIEVVRTEIGRWSRYLASTGPVKLEEVRVRSADKPKLDTERVMSAAGVLLPRVKDAVIGLGVTLVLTYFMLLSGRSALRTAIALIRSPVSRRRAMCWVRVVQQQLTHYLLAVTAINVCFGIATAALLAALGVPSAIFWGTVAGVLNFIPFLGALLSTALVSFAALGADTLGVPTIVVPLAFFALHMTEAEFVTPMVLGRRLTLNPLFMIVAVLVFGTAWGLGGAFLAVPLLIVAKISFAVLPGVSGWSQVLGRRRFEGVALRLQRLRARLPRQERAASSFLPTETQSTTPHQDFTQSGRRLRNTR
ncbi:MAG: AI-2E family transporter [Steroidobacteraceae bacterium]